MAPSPRVVKAFRAMKDIGISEHKVKPVLKNLLKLYDKNWELIEEENYRALADAIFEKEEAQAVKPKKPENIELAGALDEEATLEEPERPLKRLRLKYQESQPAPSQNDSSATLTTTALLKPKLEVDDLPNDHHSHSRSQGGTKDLPQPSHGGRAGSSHPIQARNKGKQPMMTAGPLALIKPKDEPFTDDMPHYEAPIAIIPAEPVSNGDADSANRNHLPLDQIAHQETLAINSNVGKYATTDIASNQQLEKIDDQETLAVNSNVGKDARNDSTSNQHLEKIEEDRLSSNLDIASSRYGEVKISINCAPVVGTNFHLPSLEAVLKLMEDKCLRAYKILDPNFSVTKLMEDFCECVLDLGTTKLYNENQEATNATSQAVNQLEASLMEDKNFESSSMLPDSTNELLNFENDALLAQPQMTNPPLSSNGVHSNTLPDECVSEKNKICAEDYIEKTKHQSMAVVGSCNFSYDKVSVLQGVIDITNGQEKMMISIVNEVNNECPPLFHYIPQNAVFQKAYVNLSLALIDDHHSCPTCAGDCLSLDAPCACGQLRSGAFAYTKHGLIKEELLQTCVSLNQDPKKHNQFFCRECPAERSKNDDTLEPCKGHLGRTFIKECWWKCGCSKQCGNRVVQRGISRKLQVFMTSEAKGWGLRTLEDLPRGAFICEFVGEILTNAEFYGRVSKSPNGEKHFHPVLLDAGWGSGGLLKDEEALCLDATHYGNIARFINHRCFDSNLVEIPIEIESPNRHYYHLAFFTAREVKALEELTWDYGIDFDDLDHPIKAFQCECQSQFCRNIKRSSRSRGRR
ncbi:unnamed protein product [Cuscuta europaea]|uniref:Uncharacterized protein n=1 Tax=Cuscuta europaea TaxID=41803 RepID=A0A9P0YWQ6_CUSEU|nr:unnamed protein product [Cuscuta europaea]